MCLFYYLQLAPNSLFNAFTHLKDKYGNLTYYVTESGWSTPSDETNDNDRIKYYRAVLENVLDAIDAGINIKGFMVWSLMDTFEWMGGYT